jgi:hypothetical protein
MRRRSEEEAKKMRRRSEEDAGTKRRRCATEAKFQHVEPVPDPVKCGPDPVKQGPDHVPPGPHPRKTGTRAHNVAEHLAHARVVSIADLMFLAEMMKRFEIYKATVEERLQDSKSI